MGQKIFPIFNEAGVNVDDEWQIGQMEWWLKEHDLVPEVAARDTR